jgi:hypothetical protein
MVLRDGSPHPTPRRVRDWPYVLAGSVSPIDLRPLRRVGSAWAEPIAKSLVGHHAAEIDGDVVVLLIGAHFDCSIRFAASATWWTAQVARSVA